MPLNAESTHNTLGNQISTQIVLQVPIMWGLNLSCSIITSHTSITVTKMGAALNTQSIINKPQKNSYQ